MTTKLEREKLFHNQAFTDRRRSAVIPAYSVIHESRAFYEQFIRSRAAGAKVLEYGCGATAMSSTIASKAAEIVGIDISDVAVREAAQRAEALGLNATYHVMDAERLEFADESFDLVFSVAVLHHLDLSRAYREIARVLRPTGAAIFMEPLGHNPIINLYRRLTPTMRTEDEHPLLMSDLIAARTHFATVEVRHFGLASLMIIPIRHWRSFLRILRGFETLDALLFTHLPWTRRFAWQVVMVLSNPRSAASPV